MRVRDSTEEAYADLFFSSYGTFWMDSYKNSVSDSFIWGDGTPVYYFCNGQPNNSGGSKKINSIYNKLFLLIKYKLKLKLGSPSNLAQEAIQYISPGCVNDYAGSTVYSGFICQYGKLLISNI